MELGTSGRALNCDGHATAGLITNDMRTLDADPSSAMYAAFLNNKGRDC